jgi:hypothetical protein
MLEKEAPCTPSRGGRMNTCAILGVSSTLVKFLRLINGYYVASYYTQATGKVNE